MSGVGARLQPFVVTFDAAQLSVVIPLPVIVVGLAVNDVIVGLGGLGGGLDCTVIVSEFDLVVPAVLLQLTL